MITHLSLAELDEGLGPVRGSPTDEGSVVLLVRRPAVGEREEPAEVVLDLDQGVVGDTWSSRPSKKTPDRSPHREMQLNVMNAHAALLVAAGDASRRALCGDQLYLDLDISGTNLPPGTRLALGEAVIEITAEPHNGCAKFAQRFGQDAVRFVNSPEGKELRLRGMNAKVVVPGVVRVGDPVRKV